LTSVVQGLTTGTYGCSNPISHSGSANQWYTAAVVTTLPKRRYSFWNGIIM
jgi:hypothetical protein